MNESSVRAFYPVSYRSGGEVVLMRFYEVWDQRSRNMLGSYCAEWEALALVRELEAASASVHGLALVWGDEDDEDAGGQIAAGPTLLARAHAAESSTA